MKPLWPSESMRKAMVKGFDNGCPLSFGDTIKTWGENDAEKRRSSRKRSYFLTAGSN